MNVDLFQCQWCADVLFPSQLQAPQARTAFSAQVLSWGTSPSAVEVHRWYGPAQCPMAAGYSDAPAPPQPQLADSELRSARHMSSGLGYAQLGNGNVLLLGPRARRAVGCSCPAETNAGHREIE